MVPFHIKTNVMLDENQKVLFLYQPLSFQLFKMYSTDANLCKSVYNKKTKHKMHRISLKHFEW